MQSLPKSTTLALTLSEQLTNFLSILLFFSSQNEVNTARAKGDFKDLTSAS